jgi:integrase/recombinase XerD
MNSKEFLSHLKEKNYAYSTIRAYKRVLSFFEDKPINQKLIQSYQKKIKKISPNSKRYYLACLRKYLSSNYPKLIRYIDMPKEEKKFPKNIPDQDEIRLILQKPDTTTFVGIKEKAILETFYSTGIRRQELGNLKLDDIDFVKNVIRINQGKMKKDRIIPISSNSLRWLKKYIDKVRPLLKPRINYVFVSSNGVKLSLSAFNKIVQKYSSKSCHKYRHAYATHLLQNGMKETTLQRLLGHSQINSTQIYTKITLNELKSSYKKHHQRQKWIF